MRQRKRSPRRGFFYESKKAQGRSLPPPSRSAGSKGAEIAWPDRSEMRSLMMWIDSSAARSYTQDLADCRLIMEAWRKWAVSYEVKYGSRYFFPVLKADWKVMRNLMQLQQRLMIEQAFYELDEPYSRLVTGFGAIK